MRRWTCQLGGCVIGMQDERESCGHLLRFVQHGGVKGTWRGCCRRPYPRKQDHADGQAALALVVHMHGVWCTVWEHEHAPCATPAACTPNPRGGRAPHPPLPLGRARCVPKDVPQWCA
eukprot:365684-Chlamydomonas_euryale.AAC.5